MPAMLLPNFKSDSYFFKDPWLLAFCYQFLISTAKNQNPKTMKTSKLPKRPIALVTGSNRGIGLEVARQLVSNNVNVILTSRREKEDLHTIPLLAHPRIFHHRLDVTDPGSIAEMKAYVMRSYGRLNILVNNAAINYDTWNQASTADLDEIQATLETNLMGPWRMAQTFIPLLKREKWARIVNVSSGSGAITGMGGGTPGYSVSKAALNVLTIKLAAELSGHNILVNSVCPGWVRTDMGGPSAPRSVAEGAETIVWAALLPDDGPNGKFLRDKREIPF
jgi:NAD(P)-dependent dehydrogenase (short-subunit alcohol dehydrogenase family)